MSWFRQFWYWSVLFILGLIKCIWWNHTSYFSCKASQARAYVCRWKRDSDWVHASHSITDKCCQTGKMGTWSTDANSSQMSGLIAMVSYLAISWRVTPFPKTTLQSGVLAITAFWPCLAVLNYCISLRSSTVDRAYPTVENVGFVFKIWVLPFMVCVILTTTLNLLRFIFKCKMQV